MRKIREIALVTAAAVLMSVCPVDMGSLENNTSATGYKVYAAENDEAQLATPDQPDKPVEKNGWYTVKGKRYYYKNGTLQKNVLLKIKEKSGSKTYDNIYYLGTDGVAFSGLKRVQGTLYFFDGSSKTFPCAAISGWKTVSGRKYYFLKDKKAAVGLTVIGSNKYYFGLENNVLQSGLKKLKTGYMYFSKNTGAAETNKIANNMYFNSNGYAVKNTFFTYNGHRYYVASNYKIKTGGLFTVSGNKYYAGKTGALVKNSSRTVNGKTYYFGSNYKAVSGTKKIGNYYYYFDTNGAMKKNVWYQTKYGRYYFGSNGRAVTGFHRISGYLFYFDSNCRIVKNTWKTVNGRRYYFGESGKAVTGLRKIGKSYYYFGANGILQTGLKKIGKSYYYFGTNGKALTGLRKVGKSVYYFGTNGKALTGLRKVGKSVYYFGTNGKALTGLRKVGKSVYYFGTNGKALTGLRKVGKSYYYFETNGKALTGLRKVGKSVYYFGTNGKALTGLRKVGKSVYYFGTNGKALTGLRKVGKSYYYFGANGKAFTGLRKIGKYYYYFGSNGIMARNRFVTRSGKIYYFGNDGKAYTGTRKVDGELYNFSAKGYLAKGVSKIDGKLYLFDKSGKMVKNAGWYTSDTGNKYCMSEDGSLMTGYKIFNSGIYYFSDENGCMYKNKWAYANGYKFYFGNDGKRLTDVDSVLGKQDTYEIKVNKTTNVVTVYAKDGDNGFIIPVKAFVCSGGDATPLGTFYTPMKGRWWTLMGPCYGQWDTIITGDILFHSVYYGSQDPTTLNVGAYNQLGTTCSHGCIRLKAGDAKWIYDNCDLGTKVTIFESNDDGPFPKPSSVQLDYSHSWDPTDPTMAYKCKELGCHQGIAW